MRSGRALVQPMSLRIWGVPPCHHGAVDVFTILEAFGIRSSLNPSEVFIIQSATLMPRLWAGLAGVMGFLKVPTSYSP